MQPLQTKPAMNPIDLRTDMESVEAQLKHATTGEEIRRLNAWKRRLEKKLLKVQKRDARLEQRPLHARKVQS